MKAGNVQLPQVSCINMSAHAQLARRCFAIPQEIPVKEFVTVPTGDLECYCAFPDWRLTGSGCRTGLEKAAPASGLVGGATYHVPRRGVALHVTRRRRRFWVTSRDRTGPLRAGA